MLKQVKNWLENKKRDYTEGVALFEQLASDGIKEEYLGFFKKQDNPGVSTLPFTMLINKISDIQRNLLILQAHGKQLPATLPVKGAGKPAANNVVNFSTIDPDELPEDLKADYDRLKEIRPLQAKYHADVKNKKLKAADRHESAVELVALEDERKEIWRKLEVHYNANVETTASEEEAEQENDFARGLKAAQKIARLKENIANNKVVEKDETKSKKIRNNAKAKREGYEKQLTTILKELEEK